MSYWMHGFHKQLTYLYVPFDWRLTQFRSSNRIVFRLWCDDTCCGAKSGRCTSSSSSTSILCFWISQDRSIQSCQEDNVNWGRTLGWLKSRTESCLNGAKNAGIDWYLPRAWVPIRGVGRPLGSHWPPANSFLLPQWTYNSVVLHDSTALWSFWWWSHLFGNLILDCTFVLFFFFFFGTLIFSPLSCASSSWI